MILHSKLKSTFALVASLSAATVAVQVARPPAEAQPAPPHAVKADAAASHAEPRPVATDAAAGAAPDLLPDELHAVKLFEAASPAIVNVDVTARRVNPWSRAAVDVPAGSGSGFLWDSDGHVVTNYHVIRNASGAMVTLQDQTQLPAKLVGVSPDHDLAVLKIEHPENASLTALPVGRSETLRVGQRVYAIGNPFGLDHTLTTGIVSALDREIQSLTGRTLDGVVQTDAAINPGNSGGPLLDSSGRIIGVNTMIFSPSGASAGVGFAIPIDTVNRVVPQLIAKGEYTRPKLGIHVDDRVSRSILRQLNLEGVLVLRVEPDTPAGDAELRPTYRDSGGQVILGDVLLAIDGTRIQSTSDLLNTLDRRSPGQTLELRIHREGKEQTINLTLK